MKRLFTLHYYLHENFKVYKRLFFAAIIILISVQFYQLNKINNVLNEKFELITALLADLDEDLHEINDSLADHENEYYMNKAIRLS